MSKRTLRIQVPSHHEIQSHHDCHCSNNKVSRECIPGYWTDWPWGQAKKDCLAMVYSDCRSARQFPRYLKICVTLYTVPYLITSQLPYTKPFFSVAWFRGYRLTCLDRLSDSIPCFSCCGGNHDEWSWSARLSHTCMVWFSASFLCHTLLIQVQSHHGCHCIVIKCATGCTSGRQYSLD